MRVFYKGGGPYCGKVEERRYAQDSIFVPIFRRPTAGYYVSQDIEPSPNTIEFERGEYRRTDLVVYEWVRP